ncbi:MAG: oligosaccharide flippase family protein, partial [Bacteroidota bacterium]
ILSAVAISEALTEVGVRQSVIHSKEGETEEFLNAAWWFSCIRGTLLYIIALLLVPFICDFYNTPEIRLPMGIAFSALLINGLVSPRMYLLEKRLSYFKLITIQQGAGVLNVLITIIMSLYIQNIWPLVIGFIFEILGRFLFSFVFLPFRIRFKIDRFCLSEIFKFARGMFGLPILTSLFFQYDIFIIGKLFSMEQLGLYSVARAMALVLVNAFGKTVNPLVLPAFSKLQNDFPSLNGWHLKITDLVCLFCMPVVAVCIVTSQPLLSILYGPRYGTVSLSFSILMGYTLLRILSMIIMQLFLALGRPDIQRRISAIRVIVILPVAYPAAIKYGLPGVALTVLFGMLLLYVFQVIWAARMINMKIIEYSMCLLRGLFFSSLVVIPVLFIRNVFQYSEITVIGSGILFCIFSWGIASAFPHYRKIISG